MGDFIGGLLIFFAMVAVVVFFMEPVFRTIVIVVVLLIIVLGIALSVRGGRSRSNSSSGGFSGIDGTSPEIGASGSGIGCVYRGPYAGGFVLASYRDGKVFDGYNSGTTLSFYEATYDSTGKVYGSNGSMLGHYEGYSGYIYRGWSDSHSAIIGRCERGYIYDSTTGSHIVGSYVGEPEGAAAAALVFLF